MKSLQFLGILFLSAAHVLAQIPSQAAAATPSLPQAAVDASATSLGTSERDRIDFLSNYNAIRQVISLYSHNLDFKKFGASANLFTERACLEVGYLGAKPCGRQAIQAFLQGFYQPPGRLIQSQNHYGDITINFEPRDKENADVVVYAAEFLYGQKPNDKNAKTEVHGYYSMTMVRVRNGPFYPELVWQISGAKFTPFVSLKVRNGFERWLTCMFSVPA